MIGEKRSRSRRRWKTDNPGAGDSIVEHLEYANYSFENETANLINRTTSDSSGKTGNSRQRGKHVYDESEVHAADSDNLTYTKDAPETMQEKVGSPVNTLLKVEEFLTTRQEKLESETSPDNDHARTSEKRRKIKTKRRERDVTLGSTRTEDVDAHDDDNLLTEKGESGSPENHPVTKQKRRKWQKIQMKEITQVMEFSETIEDGRESESPENGFEANENRRRSKQERDERDRTLEFIETIDGCSVRRETVSPEDNPERREERRRSRREEREKNRNLESNAANEKNTSYDEGSRSSESPENNPKRREKRRRSRKERRERSRVMASNRTLDGEAHDEDARSISDRRESAENDQERREKRRRKSKKLRKEKSRTLESSKTLGSDAYDEDVRPKSKKSQPDEPRISRRRKRRRSNADSSRRADKQEKELPITEILRKAQENSRNRYEEPVPLPELTTDTIYVQGRNGFSAVKMVEGRSARSRRRLLSRGSRETTTLLYPIKVAIAAQTVWNSTGLIHQGLLAGMALMHLILIHTFFELSLDFLVKYSLIAELYTNIFSFLVTMCVVSVFDKFDLAHLDLAHVREIYVEHSRSFLAVPLYVSAFCLHQASLLVDDKVALMSYEGNATGFESNSTESIVEEDLATWQKVSLAKDGLAVLAWLFVALGPREDMLLTHLKTMGKYADSPETSRRDIVEAMRREHDKQAINNKTVG